jgi:hypothetical protein
MPLAKAPKTLQREEEGVYNFFIPPRYNFRKPQEPIAAAALNPNSQRLRPLKRICPESIWANEEVISVHLCILMSVPFVTRGTDLHSPILQVPHRSDEVFVEPYPDIWVPFTLHVTLQFDTDISMLNKPSETQGLRRQQTDSQHR